ncbi:hypothetical protein [Hymenobacter psychrotolerans]|uniref:Dolichyl-phosphate-mannose-protein mannosyltransferase n=1 Tax=Hymenobacter psychrotolerans DSM 18569 TaxID=1121959 RepID=A0A1M7G8A6_9BACT|nr:hypothetical protein [Hymenobacter psychrotolerans]SHM12520.1 hypothetical protein SAMN02746009_03985 [Hymenobacter psychrotolerans DSM 18569]
MSFRPLLLPGLLCLLLSSGFLLLIFGPASYEQVQVLSGITYHEGSFHHLTLALTPARYALLRGGLAAVALASGGALLLLRHSLRQQGHLLHAEWQQVQALLGQLPATLSTPEKLVGGSLLVALLLTWLWYLIVCPISTDEAASFDYFIHEGPLAISSFYPIPNNHLLFNFLCWPLSLLSHNLRLVMRLPTLVVAVAATAGAYLLLSRQLGFRAATLGIGLFGFSPLGVFYAVAGRGYFLQLALLLAAFFAALALWRRAPWPRLAWAVFISSSILGLYTIPTFVYPLAALGLGLLAGFVQQRRWPDLARLAVAGATVAATAVLLYLPVMVVSGLPQLLGNRYVAPLLPATFWLNYTGYLHVLADTLAGASYLGVAVVAVLGLALPLLWWKQPALRPILAFITLLLLVPVLLMAVQQVLVPARVLLFMACFSSMALGIAGAGLLRLARIPVAGQLLLMLLIGGYAGYVQIQQAASLVSEQQREHQLESSYEWLTGWDARRVFLASPWHELFMHHYALLENRPLLLHTKADPAIRYDLVVLERGTTPPDWVASHYVPVYEDALGVFYGPRTAQ